MALLTLLTHCCCFFLLLPLAPLGDDPIDQLLSLEADKVNAVKQVQQESANATEGAFFLRCCHSTACLLANEKVFLRLIYFVAVAKIKIVKIVCQHFKFIS